MEKLIPYEKRSKKERRLLDRARRGSWNGVTPVTRKKESAKAYNRKKARRWEQDPDAVSFFFAA